MSNLYRGVMYLTIKKDIMVYKDCDDIPHKGDGDNKGIDPMVMGNFTE